MDFAFTYVTNYYFSSMPVKWSSSWVYYLSPKLVQKLLMASSQRTTSLFSGCDSSCLWVLVHALDL